MITGFSGVKHNLLRLYGLTVFSMIRWRLKKYLDLVLRLLLKDIRHARRRCHPHFYVVSVLLVTPVEASNLVDSGGQKVVALGVLFGFRQ